MGAGDGSGAGLGVLELYWALRITASFPSVPRFLGLDPVSVLLQSRRCNQQKIREHPLSLLVQMQEQVGRLRAGTELLPISQ